jgi:hypothetical protein
VERGNGVELLNKRVVVHGIELGQVVDVILDQEGERPLGLQVLCGDGENRFLPLGVARIGHEEIKIDSALTLLDARELDFYRRRGRPLSGLSRQ